MNSVNCVMSGQEFPRCAGFTAAKSFNRLDRGLVRFYSNACKCR